jgi:hypothetical protein
MCNEKGCNTTLLPENWTMVIRAIILYLRGCKKALGLKQREEERRRGRKEKKRDQV